MLRLCLTLLRLSGQFALYAYFALMLVLVGVRYVVLPNIETWRTDIAGLLSRTLDTPVAVGSVQASWQRWYPQFSLHDVTVLDKESGEPTFHLPLLQAELGWRTLLGLRPQFRRLVADGLELHVRRDIEGQWHVLGQSIAPSDDAPDATVESMVDLEAPAWRWLAMQGQLALSNATVYWRDDTQDGPPLVWRGVSWSLRNQGTRHQFEMRATKGAQDAGRVVVQGDFYQGAEGPNWLASASGQLYVQVQDLQGEVLRDRLGWQEAPAGVWSAQVWASLVDGAWKTLEGQGGVSGLDWQSPAGRLRVGQANWQMNGEAPSLSSLIQRDASASAVPPALRYRLQMQDARWTDSDLFERPLAFDAVAVAGAVSRSAEGHWQLRMDPLTARNADLSLQVGGSWQQEPGLEAGRLDLDGVVQRLRLASLVDYLPTEVNEEARAWMRVGLLAGDVLDARLSISGDLAAFPFGDQPQAGDFRLRGRLVDADIDYAPADAGEPAWPRLRGIRGEIGMQRVDLRVTADQAYLMPVDGERIALSNVQAHIPDIEREARLRIRADSTGRAAAYLAVTQRTPLASLLDDALAEASGAGQWRMPLTLDVPLLNSIDTTVSGRLYLNGGRFRLMPEMPEFLDVRGALAFTEEGILSDGMKARFLGGPVALSGGLGGKTKGLVFDGTATDAALARYVGVEGMRRLSGRLPYRAEVRRETAGYVIEARSDLRGMALVLPAPLNKPADARLPLRVRWSRDGQTPNMALDVWLGERGQARFLRQEGQRRGPYFLNGAIGFGGMPALPARGLAVSVTGEPVLDGDAWNVAVDSFSVPLPKAARSSRPLFPPLARLDVRTDQARYWRQVLNDAVVQLRLEESGGRHLTVSSKQTTGTARWREVDGHIAGHVDAEFERLTLGGSPDEDASETDGQQTAPDDAYDMPGVRLRAQRLYWGERLLGELVLDGTNQERGRLWRLDRLVLGSDSARLAGTGTWRLNGADEGLTLDGQGEIADLGAYIRQMGFGEVMAGGKGATQVHLVWRGSASQPFSLADVNGRIEFLLEQGRLSTVNSRSARLLEWLSLQSLNRLARLDTDLGGMTKEGFPFDAMRGTLILDSGHLRTANYRVSGPVGTLVLGGEVGLIDERLDLEAVVVPNLDVSGAAVAAGIAINPIVGVGAFLTQWLLREPLGRAMTARFRVSGRWDDVQVKDEPVPSGKR